MQVSSLKSQASSLKSQVESRKSKVESRKSKVESRKSRSLLLERLELRQLMAADLSIASLDSFRVDGCDRLILA